MTQTTKTQTHTPGPWGLRYADCEGRFHAEIDGPQWGALARVVVRMDDGRPTAEGEANARLIAAAPDMLATLRLVLGYAIDPHLRCIIENDIAKAEGKETAQ